MGLIRVAYRTILTCHVQIFNRAVSTRGLGSHGITSPDGPDGTFSQGAVKASAAGKVLAAVNVSEFYFPEVNAH